MWYSDRGKGGLTMNAEKTGRFIVERRKQKGYTQKELAEKLMVTDKAVSRWETGKGFPDTSLLKPLSEQLGVSVGELLAGEVIEESQWKEQTDRLLTDALGYSGKMLAGGIVNAVLIVLGVLMILSQFFVPFWGGCYPYAAWAGGAVVIASAASRFWWKKKTVKRTLYLFAIVLQAAALLLEASPRGVVLIFAPGPDQRIRSTFSYFDMTPFGYANFAPLLTAILTVMVLGLAFLALLRFEKAGRLRNAVFVCSVLAAVFSFGPLLFGFAYMNAVSYAVSGILLASLCLQAAANGKRWNR